MKKPLKINLLHIPFVLLLCFVSAKSFAQQDEKQLSIDFADDLKNAKYHEMYGMLDSSVAKGFGEANFKTTCEAIIGKLGTIDNYSYVKQENKGGMAVTTTKCNFKSIALDLVLAFNTSDKVVGFHFTAVDESSSYIHPAYDSSKLYTEKHIMVGMGRYQMSGILMVPDHVKHPPVVILVHGSGQNDKDESIGPNKPFRDLAVGLAGKGIATIRYDKRTKIYAGLSSPDKHTFTVKDETMDDAISAVNMVGSLSSLNVDSSAAGFPTLGLDSNRVYLLGHSLGAMLAPRIAREDKKIKGIIVMAGPARSLEDVMIEQYKYRASLDTSGGTATKQAFAKEIKKAELAKSPDLKPDTPDTLLPFGYAPYWIDLNHYDQVKVAEKLTIPIFILQGENDCQVSMTDYNLWKENLGKKKNVTLKSYPKLNHLFMECDVKSTGAEYEKPSNIPGYVITDIANWVNKKK